MKSLMIPALTVVIFVLDIGNGQSQEAKPLVLDVAVKLANDAKLNCASCHKSANADDELVGDICPAMVQQSAIQLANLEAWLSKAQTSKAVAKAAKSRAATWLGATEAQLLIAERAHAFGIAEQDHANAEVVERRAQALAAANLAEGQHAQALAAYHAALAKESQLNDYVVQLSDARGNAALQEYALKALGRHSDSAEGSQDAASLYWIGVQCEPAGEITVRIEQHGGNMLTVKGGLRVNAVTAESPAQAAGVQELDVILFMNDKPTNQIEDLAAIINENAEKAASLSVVRDHNLISLSVTPAKRPEANADEANIRFSLVPSLEMRTPWQRQQLYLEYGVGSPKPELPEGFEATLRFTSGPQPEFSIRKAEQSWDVTDDSISQVPEAVRPFAQFVLQTFAKATEETDREVVYEPLSRLRHLQTLEKYAAPRLAEVPLAAPYHLYYQNATAEQPATLEINSKLDQLQKQLNELRELIEALKK